MVAYVLVALTCCERALGGSSRPSTCLEAGRPHEPQLMAVRQNHLRMSDARRLPLQAYPQSWTPKGRGRAATACSLAGIPGDGFQGASNPLVTSSVRAAAAPRGPPPPASTRTLSLAPSTTANRQAGWTLSLPPSTTAIPSPAPPARRCNKLRRTRILMYWAVPFASHDT